MHCIYTYKYIKCYSKKRGKLLLIYDEIRKTISDLLPCIKCYYAAYYIHIQRNNTQLPTLCNRIFHYWNNRREALQAIKWLIFFTDTTYLHTLFPLLYSHSEIVKNKSGCGYAGKLPFSPRCIGTKKHWINLCSYIKSSIIQKKSY